MNSFKFLFLRVIPTLPEGEFVGGCNLSFLAPVFRTAEFSLKYFQVLLTIAFHQVLSVGSSLLKFNSYHLMHSFFNIFRPIGK